MGLWGRTGPAGNTGARLLKHAAHGQAEVLAAVDRRVDAGSVEVQVVPALSRAGRTGPVVAVGANVAGAGRVVEATE